MDIFDLLHFSIVQVCLSNIDLAPCSACTVDGVVTAGPQYTPAYSADGAESITISHQTPPFLPMPLQMLKCLNAALCCTPKDPKCTPADSRYVAAESLVGVRQSSARRWCRLCLLLRCLLSLPLRLNTTSASANHIPKPPPLHITDPDKPSASTPSPTPPPSAASPPPDVPQAQSAPAPSKPYSANKSSPPSSDHSYQTAA